MLSGGLIRQPWLESGAPEVRVNDWHTAFRRILSNMKKHPKALPTGPFTKLMPRPSWILAAFVAAAGSDALAQSTATNLVMGAISFPGQRDNYAFNLATSSRFYFDSLTNSSTLTWSLTGPEGAVVTDQAFSGSDAQSVNNPTVTLPAGAYTLTVRSGGGTTGGYGFRLVNL